MSTETTDLTTLYRDLNAAQADGLACVVCGEDYTEFLGDTVPVGMSITGSQVFACKTGCAATLCIVCGPGCCSPVLNVHTSCPGPAAGAGVTLIPGVGDAVEVHFPDHGGWHTAAVRELDDVGGRYLGAWVALTGGGSHWVSPDRIRPSAAAVSAR